MESRTFWFSIIMQYQSLADGANLAIDPNDQNIQFLANYFNVPFNTLAPLFNYTSLLSQLAFVGTNNLCIGIGKPNPHGPFCTYSIFFYAQFINGTLSQISTPVRSMTFFNNQGYNPANNLQGVNSSLLSSPEFYRVNESASSSFSFAPDEFFFTPGSLVDDVSLFSYEIIQAALDGDFSELNNT
jgi:hypothetical protein